MTKHNFSIRCPIKTCSGIVVEIEDDDSTFFGCGECGNVWYDNKSLNIAIAEIIEKYKYRSEVYKKEGENFIAIPFTEEPKNYAELVQKEWDN